MIHLFFEQSGTFKNEFIKLGYQAKDYDIKDDFKQTDIKINLFNEIEKAFYETFSIFDEIKENDLIIAFFPCIRFSNQAYMMFQCTQKQLKNLSELEKIKKALKFHYELSELYELICKLCIICIKKNIKLIIENPYSKEHYLTRYFPIKPKFIDIDRTRRGDDYVKPTQYWFFNCEPKNNFVAESYSIGGGKNITKESNQVKRSLINSNYAERFIKEFIL